MHEKHGPRRGLSSADASSYGRARPPFSRFLAHAVSPDAQALVCGLLHSLRTLFNFFLLPRRASERGKTKAKASYRF